MESKKKRHRSKTLAKKSPSHSHALKKVKHQGEFINSSDTDSEQLEYHDTGSTRKVSMAEGMLSSQDIIKSLIIAIQNPTVHNVITSAVSDQIKQTFTEEITNLKQQINGQSDTIVKLEQQIEELEMYGRRNGVRIHGIPESTDELTDNIVLKIAKDIGADIPKFAIGRSHRVGRPNSSYPRPIIVKFISHNFKTELLKHKRHLKSTKSSSAYPTGKIFINEDLTKLRATWAKRARILKKSEKIKDTWTRDGIIFIKGHNDKIERVESILDMENLEQSFSLKFTIPKDVLRVSQTQRN